MTIEEKCALWKSFDIETAAELSAIHDPKELEDRFYKDLAFGTGGLRGIMGAGSNRMNRYTVGKASLGLVNYVLQHVSGQPKIAIAYDSRNNSKAFAETAAAVFSAKGIQVFLWPHIVPVPVLSFTTRHLQCDAGVMITASHNPKEYNGYKVYNAQGCQLCPDEAEQVIQCVNAVEDYASIPFEADADKITEISEAVMDSYISAVESNRLYTATSDLQVVYTPLHGTGNLPVRRVLADDGIHVSVVQAQELPDGNFSTVRSPNPEEKDALNLAIEQAKAQQADLVLGTDPDCDRVGIAVRNGADYVLFTGNQTGAVLVDFVLKMKKDTISAKSTLVKTIVTSELGAEIARSYGLQVEETLTGFKYIGDKICKYEKAGDKEFVIGYEESYGYLVGTHARDKDAVVSSMLICEMASYYKNQGKTLVQVLDDIYSRYGYYLDALDSFVLRGKDGAQRISELMTYFRTNADRVFAGVETAARLTDYALGIGDLPKENVLKFVFADGSWLAVRPSGTEPKIKVYYSIKSTDKAAAEARLERIRAIAAEIIS